MEELSDQLQTRNKTQPRKTDWPQKQLEAIVC